MTWHDLTCVDSLSNLSYAALYALCISLPLLLVQLQWNLSCRVQASSKASSPSGQRDSRVTTPKDDRTRPDDPTRYNMVQHPAAICSHLPRYAMCSQLQNCDRACRKPCCFASRSVSNASLLRVRSSDHEPLVLIQVLASELTVTWNTKTPAMTWRKVTQESHAWVAWVAWACSEYQLTKVGYSELEYEATWRCTCQRLPSMSTCLKCIQRCTIDYWETLGQEHSYMLVSKLRWMYEDKVFGRALDDFSDRVNGSMRRLCSWRFLEGFLLTLFTLITLLYLILFISSYFSLLWHFAARGKSGGAFAGFRFGGGSPELQWHQGRIASYCDDLPGIACCHVHQSCSRDWTCDILLNPGRERQRIIPFAMWNLEVILNQVLNQFHALTKCDTCKQLGPEPETPCRTARQQPGDLGKLNQNNVSTASRQHWSALCNI